MKRPIAKSRGRGKATKRPARHRLNAKPALRATARSSGEVRIANKDLTLKDIPARNATWRTIFDFARTFSGYVFWGSFEKCAEIANARRHDSLTNLRTCLFFEQRRWRHFDERPDRKAMTYIRDVVEKIRRRVAARDEE